MDHTVAAGSPAAPDLTGRIAGALLGVHAGDSLGATLEFRSWADIHAQYPDGLREIIGGGPFGWSPGHATDDTDLTRAVLLAHLDPGADVVATAADRMLDWMTGNWPDRVPGSPAPDIGGATATGLRRFQQTGDPRTSGAGQGQAGNGSLMRCIPTALALRGPASRAARIAVSRQVSAITHDDDRCTASCAAYNEIVVALLNGADPRTAASAGLAVAIELDVSLVVDAIRYGESMSLSGAATTGQTWLENDGAGYVLDSLSLCLAALLDPRSLEDVLVDVIRVGKDTDTNGAIAGGLLGARDGVTAIPQRWLDTLQFRDEFTRAAAQLARTPG